MFSRSAREHLHNGSLFLERQPIERSIPGRASDATTAAIVRDADKAIAVDRHTVVRIDTVHVTTSDWIRGERSDLPNSAERCFQGSSHV